MPGLEGETATDGSSDTHTREVHWAESRHRPKCRMLMVVLSVNSPLLGAPDWEPEASSGVLHVLWEHTRPRVQSVEATHRLPAAHPGQPDEPPQSMSDS